jgi:hypothetical protein
MQTAETLVPEPRAYESEVAIEKVKSHKSRSRKICSEIHKLVISVSNKEELPK